MNIYSRVTSIGCQPLRTAVGLIPIAVGASPAFQFRMGRYPVYETVLFFNRKQWTKFRYKVLSIVVKEVSTV
jgi:hypothetical protein